MCAHPRAARSTGNRPDTTATDAPAAVHEAMAARTTPGVSVATRRWAKRSAPRALPFERAEIHVAGRQSWWAASHRSRSSPMVRDGAARRTARRSAHSSASSCRRSSACSRSPWKAKERWTVRPDTGSMPTATRISHTPGRRSRSDPLPHAVRAGFLAMRESPCAKSRDECRAMARIPAPR
jgi:hypothetical protein